MRLAIINAESGKGGGPATICDDIYYNFIKEDVNNRALVCYGRQCNDKKDVVRYKIGGKLDLGFHLIKSRLFDMHGLGSKNATRKLIKKLKEFNLDAINLHNIHGYYINYKLLFQYIKDADIPVVWTLHDCWPFTGHCAYFDLAGCDKWKAGCKSCPQKSSYPKSIWLDKSKQNYELKKELFASLGERLTIVTPSAWLAELVRDSFFKDCNIEVINNGIDLSIFKPMPGSFKKDHGIEDKKMVLALASEWTVRKGFEDIKYIGTHLPNDYQLVIVGLAEEQLSEVPSGIIAITRTDNIQQLIEIYSEADVFINASVEDNFPTVILEALACGTPVITYDTGGCKEQIDETTGVLVPKYDKERLLAAIVEFTKSNEKPVQACIEKANSFEKSKMYDKYNELFNKVEVEK